MQDPKLLLNRLLAELDDLAKFSDDGKFVVFNADAYEEMLARAGNVTVRDSRPAFPPIDFPVV
jgi:hypothetical protein